MSDKCPANYKNLNSIQSFSEQKYATIQWANQNCENDEYLKKEVDTLGYLTPPAVRKRFSPILLDETQSWGCMIQKGNRNDKNIVCFNTKDTDEILIDFTDFSLIDTDKSDCIFETIPEKTNGVITGSKKRAAVPFVQTSTVDYNCRTYQNGDGINSYWYVGFDKAKSYQVRPDWIKDYFDEEIPAIVRAQTFTIPSGISNGKLESIDLAIENNGTNASNWGSPLIVQIWRTTQRKVEQTYWDTAKRRAVPYNPKQYEYIAWPEGDVRKPLAQSIYYPDQTSPHIQNFLLDKAITVNSNEKYALVLLSPLSHYEHCPRIGGWGRNCARDTKYSGGDAFLSEDNGRNFIRYGRNDLDVLYKFGQITPQDFAFQCHIRKYSSGRDTTYDYYLYMKPIITNPVKVVTINANCYGNESSNDHELVFEVSPTGKGNSWVALDETYKVHFSPDATGEYPHMVFIRAKMRADMPAGSTTTQDTPYIEDFVVTLDLDSPLEMYARTEFYKPKFSPMLGANVWGRVYAPFTTEPSVTGSVEIIQDRLVKEHFTIITAEELSNYTYMDGNVVKSKIKGLDASKMVDNDLDVRYQYLINDPNAINILKAKGIYVKPYTYTKNNESVTDMLSFKDGIQLKGHPAYPILQCLNQADGNTTVQSYSEWIDYAFDYDNDVLTFHYVNIMKDIPVGKLSVSYNPVFIQDLTAKEVGLREDGEGLILDYFKETFIIGDDELQSRSIPLRVAPVDPIRELTINDEELHEDIDFTVDYTSKTINFPVVSTDNTSSILNANDEVSVVYTPNLEDKGISIGYRAKRTNKDKQITIKPNYIEYKV